MVKTINGHGLTLPQLVRDIKEAMAGTDEGILTVIVDDQKVADNLRRYAYNEGYCTGELKQKEGAYWLDIVKGYSCGLRR